MAKVKTETLAGKDGEPYATILPGHVPVKAFMRAFVAEGWAGTDEHAVAYEYWKPLANGRWSKSEPEKKGAVAVTVSYW